MRISTDDHKALLRVISAGHKLRGCVAKLVHDPSALDEWDAAVEDSPPVTFSDGDTELVVHAAAMIYAARRIAPRTPAVGDTIAEAVQDARVLVRHARAMAS